MATILVDIGNNCNEYKAEFQAGMVLVLLAEQQSAGTAGRGRPVSDGRVLALVYCPTCLQFTLVFNGYYRDRQVKTASPVGDVPGEYPDPVERIDLHKLHCTNPECEQPYHTVLPSFLPPYGQYIHQVRQTVMEAADAGATVYSLASDLRLFPWLIRRWKREGEELAGLVVPPLLAEAQELSAVSLVSAPPGETLSPWSKLVSGVFLLVAELWKRDRAFSWSQERLLEFVYLFCSGRSELRFWDRGGRRRRNLSHHIISDLLWPDSG